MITDLTKDQFGRLNFSLGGKSFFLCVTPHNRDRFYAYVKANDAEDKAKAAAPADAPRPHWTELMTAQHVDRVATLEIALNYKPGEAIINASDLTNNMDLNEIMGFANYWLAMLNGVALDPNAIRLAAAR